MDAQFTNPWKRDGLVYRAVIKYTYVKNGYRYDGVITRKLDFLAYHLIKWFHGDKKLVEMGTEYDADKYISKVEDFYGSN